MTGAVVLLDAAVGGMATAQFRAKGLMRANRFVINSQLTTADDTSLVIDLYNFLLSDIMAHTFVGSTVVLLPYLNNRT